MPEILAAAREANADFVAMTTHGPDGTGTLFDPVAESALRQAGVPVMIVPAVGRMLEARAVRDGKLGGVHTSRSDWSGEVLAEIRGLRGRGASPLR